MKMHLFPLSIILSLLLLVSCTQKNVSREDFDKAILEIDEYQYHEATLTLILTYDTKEKNKQSTTISYNEKQKCWSTDYFASLLEPLKKNGEINNSSTYYNIYLGYPDFVDDSNPSFYLNPFKIIYFFDNEQTSVSFSLTYNEKGYLTNLIGDVKEVKTSKISNSSDSVSKMEYIISYK